MMILKLAQDTEMHLLSRYDRDGTETFLHRIIIMANKMGGKKQTMKHVATFEYRLQFRKTVKYEDFNTSPKFIP